MVAMLVMMALIGTNPDAPTPLIRCREAVALMHLNETDILYDLGCGDGRVCITASELTGCRAVGVDIQAAKIETAREAAKMRFVADRTAFYRQDILEIELDKLPATVFYVYLPQELLNRLLPRLEKCKGARVISYMHQLIVPLKAKHGEFYFYQF